MDEKSVRLTKKSLFRFDAANRRLKETNAISFEEEYADKNFELFQRLHSKTEYPGTGIGLAICKKIVQNHGGHIRAISTPGEGSVFEVFLPFSKVFQPTLEMT